MKRLFLSIMVVFMTTISLFAQQVEQSSQPVVQDSVAVPTPLYGVISYTRALQSMPEYADMELTVQKRRSQYDEELQRAADEFNDKYETFLTEQKGYAPSILRKHQEELENLLSHNEQFKKDCQQDLEQLRKTLLAPITDRLTEAINSVAKEYKLAFVLNSDNNSVPYTDPTHTLDITESVIAALSPQP